MRKIIMLLVIGIGLLLGALAYQQYISGESGISRKALDVINNMRPSPTPTPGPYDALTIPFLRESTYESSLSELEQYESYGTYTSYLTSYDSDGLRINGLLTIPQGDQPKKGWPAIVFIHGYIPPNEYQTTTKYVVYVDYLARSGYVVFKIDLRGHGDSEGRAGGTYFSSDYIVDTLSARAALQNTDFVNPDAIGLWGHSMAGNVVLRSIVAAQDIPAAVVWAGAVYTYDDLQEYRLNDSSYQRSPIPTEYQNNRKELYDTHGEFDRNNAFWKQVIPTNYLDGITSALQLHHAVGDSVVSVEYSRNLVSILDDSTMTHELYEYSSADHNISSPYFNTAMERTVAFFDEYLKDF
ncbi:MAG: alpha/beta fold hydrolase [bacterium]|nr:alpha/beta fold hydrolase [bacterium]